MAVAASNDSGPEPAAGVDGWFRRLGPNARYERWRWQTFAITWLAYAGFNLTRMSFAASKVGVERDAGIDLSERQMAWIDGAFLSAYALGQFFWGIAGDRFGPRTVVLAGMLCSALTGAAMGACSRVTLFVVLFFVQGLCQSSGWSPLIKNMGNFFSRRERGFVLGLWCSNYAVGGLVASVLAGFLAEHWGWRYAFFVPAGVLLSIALLFYFLQRNRPEDVGLPSIESYHHEPVPVVKAGDKAEDEAEGSWQVIRDAATNPTILLLGLVYFCIKPTRYAILFWGPKYIYDRLGSGLTEAGFLSALFELAGPFSIVLTGFLSDRLFASRRIPISIISLGLLAILLLGLDRVPAQGWALAGSLFLLGFLAHPPDALIGALAALDFGTKKGASTASGLINGLGSLGALVGGVIPGLLEEKWGWHGVFACLSGAALMAALLLVPKWNAVPPTAGKTG